MTDSFRDRSAAAVLIAGAFAVILVATPYKTFELDRYFVPKELVLHLCAAVSALCCLSTRRRAGLAPLDLLLALFLVVSGISAVRATNWWLAQRALAISLSGVVLFWVAGALRRAGLGRPVLVAVAAAVVLGSATSLAQAYGVSSEYFSINRSPGGTFGNRNFVAHLAAIGLPIVLLVGLTTRRGAGILFGAIGTAVIAASLVLSRSRAGWLAVLALAVPVGVLGLVTRDQWRDRRTMHRLSLFGIAGLAGIIAAVTVPNGLEWKSDSPYLDSAAGLVNYREGSGKGRLVQYSNSLHMTRASPVFGVGPGNWAVVYPTFASRRDPSLSQDDGMTANPWPSSDWIAFLSERGVAGFALLALVLLALLRRGLRDLSSGGNSASPSSFVDRLTLGEVAPAREWTGGTSGDRDRVLTAIALVGVLAATVVSGAFDAVLLLAAPSFVVWVALGVLTPSPAGGSGAIIVFQSGFQRSAVAATLVLGTVAVARSTTQVASMATAESSSRLAALERAAAFDPGSYRLRIRLAAAYAARGDCRRARPHARAAREQFPSAPEARRLAARCRQR